MIILGKSLIYNTIPCSYVMSFHRRICLLYREYSIYSTTYTAIFFLLNLSIINRSFQLVVWIFNKCQQPWDWLAQCQLPPDCPPISPVRRYSVPISSLSLLCTVHLFLFPAKIQCFFHARFEWNDGCTTHFTVPVRRTDYSCSFVANFK